MLDLNYCEIILTLLIDDMSEGVKERLTSLAEEITDLASRVPDFSGQLENFQRLDFCQPVSTLPVRSLSCSCSLRSYATKYTCVNGHLC